MSKLFSSNYQELPYWWTSAARRPLTNVDLVRSVDVAIVGSGYTGLNAALQTARAGRSTLVIEKDVSGFGCSSRNGGQVGTSFKPKLQHLEKKFGSTTAVDMISEGHRALTYIKELIATENLSCDWKQCGRLLAAHSTRALHKQAQHYATLPQKIAVEHHLISKSELSSEIDSDAYKGGFIIPDHGSLDPGKYHLELLDRVMQSGAMVVDGCEVLGIERKSNGFRLHTPRGTVDAKNVVLATNGYTEQQFKWHRQRIMPVGSFQIATEILPKDMIRTLIPKSRVISDTKLIGNYFRYSPDQKRLLFGGRVTFTELKSGDAVKLLYKQLIEVYPQLRGISIDYAWVGYVAFTTDLIPHIGVHDNLYYAAGYCGSGISLSSYFGMKVGQKILGASKGKTALDHLKFNAWPSISRNSILLNNATRLTRIAEKFI